MVMDVLGNIISSMITLGCVAASQLLLVVKSQPACQCRRPKRLGFDSWVGKILCYRKWQCNLVSLPGKSQGQRSLVGYSPWSCKESDMTEVT